MPINYTLSMAVTVAKLSNCDRDHMALKAKNICCLTPALYSALTGNFIPNAKTLPT